MKRSVLFGALLALAAAGPALAETRTSWTVQLNIGNAPPPPAIMYREAPPVVVVPGSSVYVVNDDRYDCDMFRYGVYWYVWNDGYWYRARNYRGPFRVIEARYVPATIWNVPDRRWKHHPHGGPPGLNRRHDDVVVVREKDGRGHGRGHDHR